MSVSTEAAYLSGNPSAQTERLNTQSVGALPQGGVENQLGLISATAVGTSVFAADFVISEDAPGDHSLTIAVAAGDIESYVISFGAEVTSFGMAIDYLVIDDFGFGALEYTTDAGDSVFVDSGIAGLDVNGANYIVFESDQAFTSVTLGNPSNFVVLGIDDVSFTVVPGAPTSMGVALGMLGAVRRRR